ncbi:MAG: ethanolamine ammonia-lyase reactivating factor EutA [Lachnotalea sp.]
MESIYSIGVDIGTSTTEVIISKLTIQSSLGPSLLPITMIDKKEVIYRSPIFFTPILEGELIELDKIREFVKQSLEDSGINKESIATGAVIITGETARKENAANVSEKLSEYLGEFVVATAGPKLESLLAGFGSKAQELSKHKNCLVLNLDIGGGTTNNALFDCGEDKMTYALDIGGRLVRVNEHQEVIYISDRIKHMIRELNLCINVGEVVEIEDITSLCSRLSKSVLECVGLHPMTESTKKLYITEYEVPERTDYISISGGVGEYVQEEKLQRGIPTELFKHGDIGVLLGREITKAFEPYPFLLQMPKEKIRATVIGAGAHSLSMSGSTIGFDESILPIKNVPIIKIFTDTQDYERIYEKAKDRMQLYNSPVIALGLKGPVSPSYQTLKSIASQIIHLYEAVSSPIVVLLEEDFAKALSQMLKQSVGPNKKVICLDKIVTVNGDYVDIGTPILSAIPVVIKTLIYQS